MNTAPKTWSNAFTSLIYPLAAGLAMYLCLKLMIDREVIANEWLVRYLAGHPISKLTTFMFCVGVSALILIANNVFDQFCDCDKIRLSLQDEDEAGSQNPATQASRYMDQLFDYKASRRSQYLWQRLYGALSYVHRTSSSDGIEDELKYLSDIDLEKQQRRYALTRIVIWATPMLGFLGTVLGISQALGGIQVGPDNDFQAMLNSLRGSLFVAFDTTALALTLSMLLMFFQFFVDRFELQLLDSVSRRAHEELLPLYKASEFTDPQTKAVERIGRTVLASSHQLVKQQSEQWKETMQAADKAWSTSVARASQAVQESLHESLRLANIELADSITRGIDRADEAMGKRWEQWQVILSENARQLNSSQKQIQSHVELLQQLLEKIENVNDAQHMINKNLDALATTSRLHETLQRLTLAIEDLKSKPESDKSDAQQQHLKIHRHSVPAHRGNRASNQRKAA